LIRPASCIESDLLVRIARDQPGDGPGLAAKKPAIIGSGLHHPVLVRIAYDHSILKADGR
jgi:hypothetical protein